jgi:hypothetical protein
MAYFNHAFYKSFLASSVDTTGGTKTKDLVAGELALVDGSDWTSVSALPVPSMAYLVQGSFHTQDNIGNNPGHGGYSESVKSKGINPRYLTRIWESECCNAQSSTLCVAVDSDCAPCGEVLFFRLDVKGSPALRYLNHNAYVIADSSRACCATGQSYVDPAVVLANIGNMALLDPIVKPFIAEAVGGGITVNATALNAVGTINTLVGGTGYTNGTFTNVATTGGTGTGLTLNITVAGGIVIAASIACPGGGYTVGNDPVIAGGNADATVNVAVLVQSAVYTIAEVLAGNYPASLDPVTDAVTANLCFRGAYVETKFGDCSFDTRDFYEKEPVQLIGSMLNETGDPCNDCGVVTTTPGSMQQTSGETVLRALLMTENYMQSPYNQGNADSARIREIVGSDKVLAAVNRTALYKTYYVQHSVPRLNNPTGVFDNDQYVYQIFVPCEDTADQTKIETLLDALVTAANASGNPILREAPVNNNAVDACATPIL